MKLGISLNGSSRPALAVASLRFLFPRSKAGKRKCLLFLGPLGHRHTPREFPEKGENRGLCHVSGKSLRGTPTERGKTRGNNKRAWVRPRFERRAVPGFCHSICAPMAAPCVSSAIPGCSCAPATAERTNRDGSRRFGPGRNGGLFRSIPDKGAGRGYVTIQAGELPTPGFPNRLLFGTKSAVRCTETSWFHREASCRLQAKRNAFATKRQKNMA